MSDKVPATKRLPKLFEAGQKESIPVAPVAQPRHWWQRRTARSWFVMGMIFAILVGLQLIDTEGSNRPYDPDSTYPSGTKAFVELMQRTGAQVVRDNRP